MLTVKHFLVPLEMMIGQPEKGDPQTDNRRDRQEGENIEQRPVHLVQMQRHDLTVRADILQCRVIASSDRQRC